MSRTDYVRLHVEPVTLAEASAYVTRHHRHHGPARGHKFSLAIADPAGKRRGVAIVGRPSARMLDDGLTLEATRVCTDGATNACSALLGAAWRAARELGYHRLVTYTQAAEAGASLRGAGWRQVAQLRARSGWDTPGRPRTDKHPTRVPRLRWEIATAEFRNASEAKRDETPRCPCGADLPHASTGRPARYCSAACRQAAYRRRTATCLPVAAPAGAEGGA